MIESAGTSVLAGPDEIELEREPTERALEMMGRLSTSGGRRPSITTSEEDPARLGFESGSSAFMINYPFVYPSAKENAPDVFKVMGAAKYPAVDEGIPSAPPLGGINLGVSAYSQNQDLAFEAIECLIQPENQLATATAGGLPPVREDLYDTKEIEKVYPGFSQIIRESIDDGAARPSESPAYRTSRWRSRVRSTRSPTSTPRTRAQPTTSCTRSSKPAVNREGLL